ncbi:HAD family hydrolase [Methanothermobacter sp.]|uniref:HAD family hydrolase n=1 Tax=Methanothermobacter sp. TaxID=1884223 RepID=UPI003C71EF20
MIALFDIDKTLIHRSEVHEEAFSYAFREVYGVDATVDLIDYHGKTDPAIAREVLGLLGLESEDINEGMDDFLHELAVYVEKNIQYDDIRLIDGVMGFLEALRSINAWMGIVTGNLEEIAFMKLERAGIAGYFSFGGFGSDSPIREELTEIAVKRGTERCASGRIVLFGDTPHDMMAGAHVGALKIGIAAGRYGEAELRRAGADHVFRDYLNPEIMSIVTSEQF